MKRKILIVEDQFVEANDIRLMLEKAGHNVCGIARSVSKALELYKEEKPDLVLLDIFLKGAQTGIDFAKILRTNNTAFIFLSANSNEEILTEAKATEPDGFLVKPFREKDLLVTLEIACYRHDNSLEATLHNENLFVKQLKKIVTAQEGWQETLLQIAKAIQPFIPFDFLGAGFKVNDNPPHNMISFLRTGFDEYQMVGMKEIMIMSNLKMNELVELQNKTIFHNEPMLYDEVAFQKLISTPSMKRLIAQTFEVKSQLALPVLLSNGKYFFLFFFSRRGDAYQTEHLNIFNRLEIPIKKSIEVMLAVDVKAPFEEERKNEKENRMQLNAFSGVIGKSHLLLTVFDHVMQVAPVDTSVLVLGESGTGKERIADAIHQLSPRKQEPLIKVNCAALPSHLIESELFGHERGAFTGALEKRIGKFEQAHKGTIFLDEIGEMPMEMQAKLLRVLQQKEIERIGGRSPIKIDVRIIAATNRNLEKEVAEGRFRLDLYYRLNIFPIVLPSLRERKEDIPLLIEHFIHYFNRKAGKKITGISDKVMNQLIQYDWPGNVRELENMIERSILLAKSNIINEMILPTLHPQENIFDNHIKSIEENERDHIINALKKTKGKIWGEGGAAELLGVPPTTLNSKIKKLGIQRD
ncbi:MAG: sigma 54-interacting transcriptional regulator [Cyclobacteriaceae bacterium]|nr:sigma 54-interacting transcriptional regulator [Cyclobacteriaceae bacterium]